MYLVNAPSNENATSQNVKLSHDFISLSNEMKNNDDSICCNSLFSFKIVDLKFQDVACCTFKSYGRSHGGSHVEFRLKESEFRTELTGRL